jgi:dipeptidyl aminopeptidase/acylaminoacyl peptidase
MAEKRVARYGTWESPVTRELVAGATIGLSEPALDGEAIYWLESRPAEGRRALVRWTPAGGASDAVPAGADIGTRVHEYGGGAYAVLNGTIVYSERSDNSVWLSEGALAPRRVAAIDGCRYAGFAIDAVRGLVYAVREDHRDRPPTAPENTVVALTLDANADPRANDGRIIASGTDFVLAPQVSPDGTQLAWIAWDQPDMPWDATRLNVADLTPLGTLTNVQTVAGAGGGEAIAEARWTTAGVLIYTSDRTNWWNAYARVDDGDVALAPLDAEFGEPHWVFGRRMLAPLDAERVLCAFISDGVMQPGLIANGTVRMLPFGPVDGAPLPYGDGAVFVRTPPDAPSAICVAQTLETRRPMILRASSPAALEPGDISAGEAGTVPTGDGEQTHYTFYPPRNAHVTGPAGAKPPLLVMSHGGPTSMHLPGFQPGIQWWTSRGFAVAHVNYRGSSGFGRAYRNRLSEAWGLLDVLDCISVARALAAAGRVDPERIAIRGGSSSGMTALLAVATSDVFRAAASLYGVMELESLAAETHKFEARYTDGLIGPLPETRQRYLDRSPVNHVATIDVPVILFQGLDDRTVPPSQAVAMRDALTERGVPVTYQAFAGEGHGFRKAETVQRVLEMELAFYRDVFGLTA